jgi:hypothetical protein
MEVAGFLNHLTTEINQGRQQMAEHEALPMTREMHSKFCIKEPLGVQRKIRKDNIKMNLKEIELRLDKSSLR